MRSHQSNAAGGHSRGRGDGVRRKPIISNPKNSYERYVLLARGAALSGDAVAAENYYQHADHYFRQMQASKSSANA